MRVLLTGATGFIGAHVAGALVARGAEVHGLALRGTELTRIWARTSTDPTLDHGLEGEVQLGTRDPGDHLLVGHERGSRPMSQTRLAPGMSPESWA
jgi:nucleoside-diphosphate-sugar epimerase